MKINKTHNEKLLSLLEELYREAEYIDFIDRKINIKEEITDADRNTLDRNNVDTWLIEKIILPALRGAIINQELPNF
jgi:hypothetical protein